MSAFTGASVCVCYQVGEDEILGWIRRGAASVEDLGEMCRAGQGCGDCHESLEELLEDVSAEGPPDER
ncbi:(2Fe-2S)-binding protein [Streptacidiphilus cavernicola]|uniref:Bacterioferritin-associated ferredoxin n=1 Tax=Streptacidiphilus cavernicola TaxID=3342716 RepID=A0ABV6VW25_9ACTN